ncbi:MAG TPA: MFS transporter [Chloroflexi bacterium]|nr:MFS transporter [Chloroflexota bacterium]
MIQQSYTPPANGFRTFVIVWLTQSLSYMGSAITFFSVTIWLTTSVYPLESQKPELARALSAMALAFAIPTVFAAPIAGSWVDRHDRKRTMMIADLLSGGITGLMLTLILRGQLGVPVLVACVTGLAIVATFHSAGFDTSYAMLVPEEQLPRANGMMQTIYSLSSVLAPGLAATILAFPQLVRDSGVTGVVASVGHLSNGMALSLSLDALTFLLSATVLAFLFIPSPQPPPRETSKAKGSLWADVKFGASFIWARRPLLWLLFSFTIANFTGGMLGVLEPLIVKFTLADNWASLGLTLEATLALIATAGSIGGIVGGVLVTAWGGLKNRRARGVIWAMLVSSLAEIVFGLSPLVYLTAAMVLLWNAMVPVMNSHSQTIWQSQTPREMQGRVFSVRRLIAQFTWPLSSAMAGILGGLFDVGAVLVVLGSMMAAWCLVMILWNRTLMTVGDSPLAPSPTIA